MTRRTWKIETEMRVAQQGERYIVRWEDNIPIIGIAGYTTARIIPTNVIVNIEEVVL